MKRTTALTSLADRGALVPASVLLLAVAQLIPGSRPVQAMRGLSRIDREFQVGETLGYYEDILNAAEPANQGSGAGRKTKSGERSRFVPFGAAGIVEARPSYLRWRIKPNLDLRWNGTTFRSNSLGYRTPEIDLEKPAGVYRIVVFGSSNTMGHGVDDEAAYPRLLETWLNEQIDDGPRIEVVNLAVSGDSPSARLERLREEAKRFQPDWILCDASPLDFSLEERHLEVVVRNNPPIDIPFPFVRDALSRAGITAEDSPEAFRGKLRSVIEVLLEGSYAGWKETADRLGLPMTMIIIPRADRKTQSPRIIELMRSIAENHEIDVIDISTAFENLEEDQFRISEQDKHPSVVGHLALFEALQRAIRDRDGLPGLKLSDTSSSE